VNVIVVGAGVVGCAVAHALAARGVRVRVLDTRGVGQGATRASAGMLAPYIEGGHEPAIIRLGARSIALYDQFVADVQRDAGRDIEYRRCGTLQVAVTGAHVAELREIAVDLGRLGVPLTLHDSVDARRLEPGLCDGVQGALEIPMHGYVRAAALTTALAYAAVRHGALIEETRVTGFEPTPSGVRVRTEHTTLEADAVVIAAGSWASALSLPVKPIRGQLLQLRLPQPPAGRVLWGPRCYVVPWQDGTTLVGATVEDVGFDESVTAGGVHQLLDAAIELLPGLGAALVEDIRAGLRPMAPDGLPAIGASSTMPGVYYALGHYRNGVLLAPLTASLVADLVLDGRERPELELVRPARFGL
jgi:glycine oxidase